MKESSQQASTSSYRSYLLRQWIEDTHNKFPWRIALINLQTGERWGFVDFESLANFLNGEISAETSPPSKEQPEPPL